jgi:hypothetical protein
MSIIHVSHNFTENFLNAIGASDEFMQQEMLIDEVGRLICENKRDIVALLRNNNINITIRDKETKIAQILPKYIYSDEKIRLAIASLIIQKAVNIEKLNELVNDIYNPSKDSSTKTTIDAKFSENIKAIIGDKNTEQSMTTAIANNLQSTFDSKVVGDAPSALETNSKILQERVLMNQLQTIQKLPMWAKVSIGIGVTVLIVGAVYLIGKLMKKSSDIPLDLPTPQSVPNPTVSTPTV